MGAGAETLRWELYLTRLQAWAQQLPEPSVGPPQMVLGGALPVELRERAAEVLDLLAQASERTRASQADVGRQLSALRQVPPLDGGEARYLDTSG